MPADEARVPVYDAGFLQGTTVTEQLRTFGGQLFRLEQHLQRLSRSLEIVGVDCGYSSAELQDIEETIFANGQIEPIPAKRSMVSSRISGRVDSLHVNEGDRVEEGDLLLEVESRQPGDPPPVCLLSVSA